jgi:superfamily II DNA/RNA helicase
MKFQALGLPEKLCAALTQNGISDPTAVQEGAIPVVLSGRDLLSSAKTGSGKTLAYALPTITRLLNAQGKSALVLVPTREIGVQVQQVMETYLRALGMPPATLIIGGVSFGPQIQNLKRRPPVVIATPGRLNDHIKQAGGKFKLDHFQALILDEADRMLDMGFLPQVRQIVQHLPRERQTLLFSATMPSDLARACKEMLNEPERVAVDAPNTANADIEQRAQDVESNGKQDALLEALGGVKESALVFARTKRRTDRVAQFLEDYGVKAERIHGDRSQAQRQKAIDNFRKGKVKVLVATDIAARGLDIPLVELVINFDLPEMREDYVHRIGRTGRAGAQGVALSFVAPEERGHWASLTGERRNSSGRPSGSGRPFGRGGDARPAPRRDFKREERREDFKEEAPREEAQESTGGWSKPAKREWSERPKRSFGDRPAPRHGGRFESRSQGKERSQGDHAPRSQDQFDRPNRGERGERPPRHSRFQRWGQPRGESSAPAREAREPRNPKHIFTGREGDGEKRRAGGGRFGGHGRSAPPAQGAPRGRWSKKANRPQPTRDSSW